MRGGRRSTGLCDPVGVGVDGGGEGGIFQEVLFDRKLGGDNRTGSISMKCLPDVP